MDTSIALGWDVMLDEQGRLRRFWRFLFGSLVRGSGERPASTMNKLDLEMLESRWTPSATINSGPGAIAITVPTGETASLTLSGGAYVITDPNGISVGSTGGILANANTVFEANDPA